MGSGFEGIVDGHRYPGRFASADARRRAARGWAVRALRRASWRSALSIFVSIDGRSDRRACCWPMNCGGDAASYPRVCAPPASTRIVMVTGDRADSAETIGAALDLDAVLADRVPADKVEAVAAEQRLHPTLMVGDGINDAPALAAADVGIAMGARGATASSEAADVVILVDRLDRVAEAVAIARRTHAIAMQSIVAGMALSGLAMGAAAFGWLTPCRRRAHPGGDRCRRYPQCFARLGPRAMTHRGGPMPEAAAQNLRQDHERLSGGLDRLRQIADCPRRRGRR